MMKDLLCDFFHRKDHIPEATVWKIAHDVANGLEHIHSCGLVHLDIKPANILIDNKGILKIGDFGMATTQGPGEDGEEGDQRYMAPELLASNDHRPSADIFSLALTLYETCLIPSASSLPSEVLHLFMFMAPHISINFRGKIGSHLLSLLYSGREMAQSQARSSRIFV